MRIKVLTTFLEGPVKFTESDFVTVPDEDGQRFIDNGWAVDATVQDAAPTIKNSPPGGTNLFIQDMKIPTGTEVKNG